MLKWFADRLAQTGKEVRKDQRGFTLIELLVVVIIIGILAAIAIPVFLGQRENALVSATQSDVRNAVTVNTALATDDGNGIANGTYNSGDTIGSGDNSFTPSQDVAITVNGSVIRGNHAELTGGWSYSKSDGTYSGTGAFN